MEHIESAIQQQEPICALATPEGVGAIGVIRVSGAESIALVGSVFKGKDLRVVASHTAHFGTLYDGSTALDEVLVTVFRSPRSFTKEDVVEIGCHGSTYIIRQILKLLVRSGARMATPGEFTQRAFLNGQFDLVQAEAVADLIAADSEASHRAALTQLRGGFSRQLAALRDQLIHFASLVELELDFGEEDVEFAQRDDLRALVVALQRTIAPLLDSFQYGNAVKEGVPVAIIGSPNVGKSTLLNTLLNEEKAIVTPQAGTTRDIVEDVLVLSGIKFRFIDTAGIRQTDDLVEAIGIERSKQAMQKARIVLFLYDDARALSEIQPLATALEAHQYALWIRTKGDLAKTNELYATIDADEELLISAHTQQGIEVLKERLVAVVGQGQATDTLVTNLRHYEQLSRTQRVLDDVLNGLDQQLTGDFLAQDIRLALYHLGLITGAISSDDLLAKIFSSFCIGK